jgi:crotonobetainyl-CoA:carnitine CoA-transferase CaiB-like acyl-CoA transferase
MDYGCGLTSCAMVLAALFERQQSGVGQYLEVPQTGAGLLAMSDVHGTRAARSETFPLDRELRGHAATNALYRTADGWVMIACYSEREWTGVRRAFGLEEAAWPSYREARNQRLGASAAAKLIEAALAPITKVSALRRLRAEDVPCAVPAPLTPAEVIVEPTLRSRSVIVAENHYTAGEIYEVGHTVRFGAANAPSLRPAPVLGQHSVDILRELGRSDCEIEALIANKVVNAVSEPSASAVSAGAEMPVGKSA